MDPNNQQPDQKPDYGFITDQNDGKFKPKISMNNKKKLFVVSFMALMLTMVSGIVIYSVYSNAKETPHRLRKEAVEQYFTYLSDYKVDEAFNLLSSETQSKANVETFTKETANVLVNSLDLRNCKEDQTQQSTQAQNIVYECKALANDIYMVFTFNVVEESSTYKIQDYTMEAR